MAAKPILASFFAAFLVTMLITPLKLFSPYLEAAGPFMISMRSIFSRSTP